MGSNTSQIVLWCHIYCTKCGTPAIGAAKFCHKCGQPHVSKVAQTNLQEYNEFSSSTDEELPPSKRSANSPGAKLLAADGNWNRSGALIPSRGGGSGKSSGWRQRNTEAPWMMDDVDKDLHCVCNAVVVARILATLISGGYLGWILYVFIFDLDDPNPNPDPNMDINWHYYVSPPWTCRPSPIKIYNIHPAMGRYSWIAQRLYIWLRFGIRLLQIFHHKDPGKNGNGTIHRGSCVYSDGAFADGIRECAMQQSQQHRPRTVWSIKPCTLRQLLQKSLLESFGENQFSYLRCAVDLHVHIYLLEVEFKRA